ncbi:MAG: hypothetical protein XD36_1357 [Halomonas sp. 54_146]|nr:MAG: hypothetical protein XD36_1357 [Halomonas sp. 54_146]
MSQALKHGLTARTVSLLLRVLRVPNVFKDDAM